MTILQLVMVGLLATAISPALSQMLPENFVTNVQCGYLDTACICPENAQICKFTLTIEQYKTFTRYTPTEPGEPQGAGRLYYINSTGGLVPLPSGADGAPICGPDDSTCTTAITADSLTYRDILAVNGQVPGPTIIVYEDQTLVINVRNNLPSEAISIHWHGLFQINTPWMDGVGGLSHCPISPGNSFRYIFKAYPSGSTWYHSHTGSQRVDGFFGGLIIRERGFPTGYNDLPEQHTIMLMDWFREEAKVLFSQQRADSGFFYNTPLGDVPNNPDDLYEKSRGTDNSVIGLFPFSSGLINGLGRHPSVAYSASRLKVFEVAQGNAYRFRLIGSQSLFAYRFSIDGHKLKVIATDGSLIEPMEVDYIIIHTGERYDFVLEADMGAVQNDFWMRAETLEIDKDSSPTPPFLSLNNTAEAILHYADTPLPTPVDYTNIGPISRNCTADQRCIAMNCPFEAFHASYYIDCIHVNDLRLVSATNEDLPSVTPDEGQEYFFNFDDDSSINGRANVLPPIPLQTQQEDENNVVDACDPNDRCENECDCSHIIDIPFNKTIRMVFSAVGDDARFFHPIHLHGHRFFVVASGYGSYNPQTGFLEESTEQITCNNIGSNQPINDVFCTYNIGWSSGPPNIAIDEFTILKDTVIVPNGGYVVIQFVSDNPGFWFMHCHVEPHLAMGMAVIINEANERQNPPPEGMRTCGNFDWTVESFDEKLQFDPDSGASQIGVARGILFAALLFIFLV